MPVLTDNLKNEYVKLFNSLVFRPDREAAIENAMNICLLNKQRYENAVKGTKIPWYFVAVIHYMEGGYNFKTHLHNGDPLTAKTIHVPKGRPLTPPANGTCYTWEESATDALAMKGYNKFVDWTIDWILYRLEGYNGFGYRKFKINTPYLWSFGNHYEKGKYKSDGIYDPQLISLQAGTACIIKMMAKKGIISL